MVARGGRLPSRGLSCDVKEAEKEEWRSKKKCVHGANIRKSVILGVRRGL